MKSVPFFFIAFLATLCAAAQDTARMHEYLTRLVENGKFNGNVLVAKKGTILFERAYGYRNAAKNVLHATNDIFQVGSVTKQFTAAIIMQLQEEGKLSVQDKLSKYFPGFVNGDKITIHHLLTHTSGLHSYTEDPELMKKDVTQHYTRDQMLEIFRKYEPDFEPGAKYRYSNSGYSMLGYIIEKVTRKPYERVVRERIIGPLKMMHTGFDFTHLAATGKSQGYYHLDGTDGSPAPVVDSTISYSAGALYSTLRDLYAWERAIQAGRILKPESWKTVYTADKQKYGYGWLIDSINGQQAIFHDGVIPGFQAYIIRFPAEEMVVIVLDNAGNPAKAIGRNLVNIAMGKPVNIPAKKESTKEVKVEESVLQQYVGEYQLAPTFSMTITLENGRLQAQATGQDKFPVYAESATMFYYKVVIAQIEFVKDTSGKVTGMILHQGGRDMPGTKIK